MMTHTGRLSQNPIGSRTLGSGRSGARRRIRRWFSIVEVVLALCILGIGLVAIMRLFSVGLASNRDAIAEKYAADSADHFLHMFAMQLKKPANDYANWRNIGLSLPVSKPSDAEPGNWVDWFTSGNATVQHAVNSYRFIKIEQKAAAAKAADFSAVYRVWRGAVTYWRYNEGAWQEEAMSENNAIAIHVEVSWPAPVPYEKRQKSLYCLEVFKPE